MKYYLSQRNQYVQFENCKSELMSVSCGVLKGSVLGPLLFLIYINDIPDNLYLAINILFADDITIYNTSKSISQIILYWPTNNFHMLCIMDIQSDIKYVVKYFVISCTILYIG